MMMHLVGKFPRRVIAFNSTLRHRMQTEDSSTAVLEYEGGAQVMMHADTIQLPTSEWWGIHGDRGTLRLDEDKVTLTTFDPDLPTAIASAPGTSKPALVQSTVETSRGEGEDSRHLGMIQDFVDAVRAGRDPLVGGVWALKCVELQAAIITSAMTGRAVDFPPDHAEYDKLLHRLARGVS
jgi:predicted dehydrogenase